MSEGRLVCQCCGREAPPGARGDDYCVCSRDPRPSEDVAREMMQRKSTDYPRLACRKCGAKYAKGGAFGKYACKTQWTKTFRTRMSRGTWVKRGHKCVTCEEEFNTVEFIPDL